VTAVAVDGSTSNSSSLSIAAVLFVVLYSETPGVFWTLRCRTVDDFTILLGEEFRVGLGFWRRFSDQMSEILCRWLNDEVGLTQILGESQTRSSFVNTFNTNSHLVTALLPTNREIYVGEGGSGQVFVPSMVVRVLLG
jgi:hypothetical protein